MNITNLVRSSLHDLIRFQNLHLLNTLKWLNTAVGAELANNGRAALMQSFWKSLWSQDQVETITGDPGQKLIGDFVLGSQLTIAAKVDEWGSLVPQAFTDFQNALITVLHDQGFTITAEAVDSIRPPNPSKFRKRGNGALVCRSPINIFPYFTNTDPTSVTPDTSGSC